MVERVTQDWKLAQALTRNATIIDVAFAPGRLKCNVDTSFSPSYNKVGIGMCVRDAEGCFVLINTTWFSPLFSVDIGEVLGLFNAL